MTSSQKVTTENELNKLATKTFSIIVNFLDHIELFMLFDLIHKIILLLHGVSSDLVSLYVLSMHIFIFPGALKNSMHTAFCINTAVLIQNAARVIFLYFQCAKENKEGAASSQQIKRDHA